MKYLVIHKFPFAVPNDPIFQARSAFFKDSFSEFIKPDLIEYSALDLLNEKGVKAVNTQDQFFKATIKENKTLYHTDDTHWNAEGVKETMKLVSPLIKK